MCHGGSGTGINFGDSKKPEFVGTVAYKNPWEFINKVRAGQPGTRMPSAVINEWSEKDILDLLSFAHSAQGCLRHWLGPQVGKTYDGLWYAS